MPTIQYPNRSQRKSQLVRLTLAFMFSLLASLMLLGGVWAKRSVSSAVRLSNNLSQISPTPDSQQTSRGASSYPDNLPHQTSQALESAGTEGSQVYINFDNVPGGTGVTNQYPPAVFSTDPSHYTFARGNDYWGSSFPNNLDRGPFGFPVDTSGYAPLYVNFTTRVNNLRFYLLAVDELRSGVAQLNIFQNGSGSPTATRSLNGRGTVFSPLLVDIGGSASSGGMGYDNITRIEIVNITDYRGVAFDDFSFTIAPPSSPTPTPSPSPTPLPPTNLIAEGDRQKVSMVWNASSGATNYKITRRTTIDNWTVIATGILPTTIAGTAVNRFEDSDVIPDTTYFYAVRAVNASGESGDSNVASATLVPSCGTYIEPRPGRQDVPNMAGTEWTLTAEVSDRDGLVISDVSLNGRYMAKMMSVPYFYLKTNRMPVEQRGELTPLGDAPTMRARLYRYYSPYNRPGINHIIAEYAVDRLTPTSKSCLLITQDYEFDPQYPGDRCEPSGTVPCARFYPRVSYKFYGGDGEILQSINIAQRLHYRENGKPENTIGLFRDCAVPVIGCVPHPGAPPPDGMFELESNPVKLESLFHVVRNGKDLGLYDNIHQTSKERVEHPPADIMHGIYGGCPECIHTHWRWGLSFGAEFGSGRPLVGNFASILAQTNQDIDIGIVRYEFGEEHPNQAFTSLVDETKSLRNSITRVVKPRSPFLKTIEVEKPADVLYWYSGKSYEPDSDLFFKHGSFFNPDLHRGMLMANATGNAGDSLQAVQDGIRSITYGHVYKEGSTTFSNVDQNTLAPLPTGYAPLDNRAYKIVTDAIVSGPHVVSFDVPSIADQSAFNNLAIFHLEQDSFDPDNLVWVDDTILSPNTPAPDFANRIVNARVNDVGYFAIGTLVQPQPDPGSSDLSVTVSDSPDPVVVENNLTYTLHVINNGPQTANGVGLIDAIPSEAAFVSASATQGTCKFSNGSVYCKLGTLANGSSVDVTVIANTKEDKAGLTSQGRSIVNTVVVAGDNDDPNLDNNSAIATTLLLPNSNSRPLINITSPTTGATFVGPANVTITATASDSDGLVSRVDFYDGGTLIGTRAPTGTANQYLLSLSANFGPHTFLAVATDNGGRTNSSDPVNVFVNGAASISITSPFGGAILSPLANIAINASATNPSGLISKIEFFADSTSLGENTLMGSNQYGVAWKNPPVGVHTLSAVLTDGSGVITNSLPVNIAVTSKPTVTILSPTDGMSYQLLSRVAIMATAQDNDGFVSKVDFYANGSLIGTGSVIGQDRFTVDWTQVPTGLYSLTAVATDNLGVSTTSPAITIGVNTLSVNAGEFIWFDDDVPPGATKHADGDVDWYWVDANPASFSGAKAHQSRNSAPLAPPPAGSGSSMCAEGGCGPTGDEVRFHQHYFDGATTTLPVNVGDKLFTYVFLDFNNIPREIMLQWKDSNSWEHRAYWGENRINSGTNGTNSRRYMGPLPKASQWVRLEVPASAVGLEGSTVNGMAFTLDGGRATWDLAGKATANSTPPPTTTPGDSVWLEDGLPAGAVTATVNDQWNWVANPRFSGQLAHQSQVSVNHNTTVYRSHSFTGAQTPMQVNPGDVLFTYVYVDPSAPAQQIMVQWYDGTGWEHRAFWGENFIGQQFRTLGVQGTESQRYMGGFPPAGSWYRLEVPASYVGLEGKTVSGMAFSVYGKEPTIAWDRSGKAPTLTTVPLPLYSTTGVWRLFSNTYGYAFETNDQGPVDHFPQKIAVFVHPNQAAGTVPFYRFRRPNLATPEYFYSRCKECYDGNGWTFDGIAFYVFSDATTPGTVPLYLYHDNQFHYFLTINQNEAGGMTLDGIAAYVSSGNPLAPAAPTYLSWDGYYLNWRDDSDNETSFKLERVESGGSAYVQVAVVPANTPYFKPGSLNTSFSHFRVRATNSYGDSAYSNTSCGCWEFYENVNSGSNAPPDVSIISPGDGEVVGTDFPITANSFHIDGNGRIAKVEFFANGNKLGEVTDPPYVFLWSNAAPGVYSLTAKATDASGATATSSPVSVTVDAAPVVGITSPTSGTIFNAPATVSINASASDSDGSISKVEFFQGTTKLGEDLTTPFSFDWTNVAAGNYVLTAKAIDNLGRATMSSPVSIAVNSLPTVSITSPTNGVVGTAPAAITINSSAADSDGTVSQVEFYQGTVLLGTDTTSPYSYTWSNVSAGNYSVTAKATDNLGATATSSAVSVTVNAPPTVSITTPASGTIQIAPANVGINASASDSDGTISKVEFFQGATLVGTVTTSPYNFTWSNIAVGNYSLTAKATDNSGAATTSSTVGITVTQGSPAVGKIAFTSNRDGTAQIYLMNTDGTGVQRLTNNAANDESPRWSTDKSRVVFQSDRDNPFCGASDIYVMNWDGSGQTRLTSDANDESAPVWSPDGTKIAFQSARNGVNYQVYVMNADGSGQVNVSNSTANDTQPSWSPDGTKIAFASDRDQPGFSSIYLMNANGSGQTRLTSSGPGFRDEQPAWSPNGMKLTFSTTRDSTLVTWEEWDGTGSGQVIVKSKLLINKEVYVMNADGSAQARLTNIMGNDDSPVWSPDGTKIAFRSDRDRNCCDPVPQIWIMNADGSNQVDLSNIGFGDYCPSWSR